MTRFQLIFTSILVFCGVAGAILFAVARNNTSGSAPQVTMWGTIKSSIVSDYLAKVAIDNRQTINVSYAEKNSATFESDLVAALARGTGPDLILLPQDLILKQLDKFYIVPFANYSERLFKDSFIEGSELYLSSDGVIGFPFSVDPMVMYWNRDIFSNAGVSLPPTSWTEFFTLAPKFIQKDSNGNITQSLAALGETRNIAHAKDIIALLALQAGTPIVGTGSTGTLKSLFDATGADLVPGEQAVSFFTEFSNPVKTSYSWNKSLSNDKTSFLAGKLALYFGYGSELAGIRSANPNLNFDVALVPQVQGKKLTFGNMTAITILKSSKNIAAAYTAAVTLTGSALELAWSDASGYPPIRRDLLASIPGDAYKSVSYKSALMSHAWLDPNKESSDTVFARLVDNVTSGRLRPSEAVHNASLELDTLLRNI